MIRELKFEAKTDEEALDYAANELKIDKEKITLEELNNADKMKEFVKEIAFLEVY